MNDLHPDDTPAPAEALPGGRCAQCGHFSLPRPTSCPLCLSEDLVADAVGGEGTIYSATVVRSGPRDRELPYGLAYVDLDAQIRVMAAYTVDEVRPLQPGHRALVRQIGESPAGLPLLRVMPHPVEEGAV